MKEIRFLYDQQFVNSGPYLLKAYVDIAFSMSLFQLFSLSIYRDNACKVSIRQQQLFNLLKKLSTFSRPQV